MSLRLLWLICLVGIGSILTAPAKPQGTAVIELILKLRTKIPEGWKVVYEANGSGAKGINVKRGGKILACNVLPNAPSNEKPQLTEAYYYLAIGPFISPEKFRKLHDKNLALEAKMEELRKQDPNSRRPVFGYEGPDTSGYSKLEAQLHNLPDYFYHDVSFGWVPFESFWSPVKDSDRKECDDVRKKIEAMLTKY